MADQFNRTAPALVAAAVCTAATLLNGCVGSGSGLDATGNPLGSSSSPNSSSSPASAPTALTADFQSIQDNVFTPICTVCHSGADAPEGLQLDAAHSYALLVGVPSTEVPGTLRVKPGDPTNSYLIQKLQNSSGIVGAQMPYGGPYLPQSTIDVISAWITAGAQPAAATATTSASLAVTATMPADRTAIADPVTTIAVGLSQEPDPSQLPRAVQVQNISAATPDDVPIRVARAEGNPSTVLLTPMTPLLPGSYRVTLHGGSDAALTALTGASLPADYSFIFTVEKP
jgi:methionine-rich copper-binding protein CopC